MLSMTLVLDEKRNEPIYCQLYESIKKEIIDGHIKGGEKLPSLRTLSNKLNLSKNTIEAAYDQLYAEGYVNKVSKVGYFVEKIDFDFLKVAHKCDDIILENEDESNREKFKYDLAPRYMDKDCYNEKIIKSIINSIINNEFETLLSYGDPQGEYELRYEISKYIYENRGVKCSPNQIIVGAGTQYCLNLACQILREEYESIGFEDPGSNYIRYIFERNKFNIKPIEVNENGINVEKLKDSNYKLAFVTPSHQFPKGVIMSIDNRIQLLNWAENNDAIIIEDDYDSEMRFVGRPIPALKSLDKFDRVIYMGTFSKIFIPSLRISYMLLPSKLMNIYLDRYKMNEQTASKLNQITLARYINKGYLDSHIRRMRKHYENKYKIVVRSINTFMGDNVNIISSNTGMRIILELKTSYTEKEIVEDAKRVGVNITPISKYYINKDNNEEEGKVRVLISYKGIDTQDLEQAIELLSYVWFK